MPKNSASVPAVTSNSDLMTFLFDGECTVRTLGTRENPLFCLADVCKVLELTNSRAIAAQIKEEFGLSNLNLRNIFDALGREREATFITEAQLYFVMMRSRAERAREFRQWVFNEVLPAIRKTGTYSAKGNQRALLDMTYSRNLAWAEADAANAAADAAIARRAQISSKREASCMKKLAVLTKENSKLKQELKLVKLHLRYIADVQRLEHPEMEALWADI